MIKLKEIEFYFLNQNEKMIHKGGKSLKKIYFQVRDHCDFLR